MRAVSSGGNLDSPGDGEHQACGNDDERGNGTHKRILSLITSS